jgi:hypothetical protein
MYNSTYSEGLWFPYTLLPMEEPGLEMSTASVNGLIWNLAT